MILTSATVDGSREKYGYKTVERLVNTSGAGVASQRVSTNQSYLLNKITADGNERVKGTDYGYCPEAAVAVLPCLIDLAFTVIRLLFPFAEIVIRTPHYGDRLHGLILTSATVDGSREKYGYKTVEISSVYV